MEFEMFYWKVQRELRKNRKPIILLFGNGFESQILLQVLLKLRKSFLVVHVAHESKVTKVMKIVHKFKLKHLILRSTEYDKENKTWTIFEQKDGICADELNFGFSNKDYLIVSGFELGEPKLVKAFEQGYFDMMYCPLLRLCDEDIECLYQNMKDEEQNGKFLYSNLTSDSHHNILIV